MRRLNWFGFWTLLGLVSGVQLFFADQRLALHPNAWWQALATTLPAWYLWGLLSLVVAWLGRRFRVDRANFGRHFFIHLGASLDLALLQLVAAVGVQDLVHAAAGGRHRPGRTPPPRRAGRVGEPGEFPPQDDREPRKSARAPGGAGVFSGARLRSPRAGPATGPSPPLPHQLARYARLVKSR